MENCTACGAVVQPDQRYCTTCGKPVAGYPGAPPEDAAEDPWAQSPLFGPPGPYDPAPPSQPPPPGARRRWIPIAMAGVVALVVVAGGIWFLIGRSDETGQAATNPSVTTPGSDNVSTGSSPPSSGITTTPQGGLSSSPVETPYWTVIVSSKTEAEGGLTAAQTARAELQGAGYDADIFQSAAHPSLNPGYWVTATGHFATADQAKEFAVEIRASTSFSTAYQRCVGTVEECT